MANDVSFPKSTYKRFFISKEYVPLKFEYLENEECNWSEILDIFLFAIFQLKDARLL